MAQLPVDVPAGFTCTAQTGTLGPKASRRMWQRMP
jgi:hypothetical protein